MSSSSRYEPYQRYRNHHQHRPQRQHSENNATTSRGGGGGRNSAQNYHHNASAAAATATATCSTSSNSMRQSAPMLDQITNLLNLAQNLMNRYKEDSSSSSSSSASNTREERYATRRSVRHHAATPSANASSSAAESQQQQQQQQQHQQQHLLHETQRLLHNANLNVHTDTLQPGASENAITNGAEDGSAAGGQSAGNTDNTGQIDAAHFCSCAECNARKLRSKIVSVARVGECGACAPTDSLNYARYQSSGSNSNNNNNHGHSRHRDNNKNFQCSICLESYLTQRPMATLCGHIFCRLCILECVNRQGKCPICNRKLNLTNVFRVFF